MAAETYDEMQARMQKAFNLVAPASHWKDRIDATVRVRDLDAAGLRIDDVREAVVHFTATVPTITHHRFVPNAYKVDAAGYRAGPAGDR
jgi:hypothetical protein